VIELEMKVVEGADFLGTGVEPLSDEPILISKGIETAISK
jgi:hypothetical protein